MKTIKFNSTNDSLRNKTRWFVLLVLLVLSGMGVFGQNSTTTALQIDINKELVINEAKTVDSGTEITTLESQIDFVGWFMGSKHNQNTNFDSSSVKSSTSTKKHIISSGVTPNKVLYRTFVKKVMNKDTAIA